jgi:hypothetical protein
MFFVMKIKEWTLIAIAGVALCCAPAACQKWGESDPPAGNQKNPDAQVRTVAQLSFDVGSDIPGETVALAGGATPTIVEDAQRGGGVLYQNGGYLRFKNPLQKLYVAAGASVSMWVKMPAVDTSGALFSFVDESGGSVLSVTKSAYLSYTGANGTFDVNPGAAVSDALIPDRWHFLAISLTYEGYAVYVDGEKKYEAGGEPNAESAAATKSAATKSIAVSYASVVELLTTVSHFYLGYDGASSEVKEAYFDDVAIWKNKISEKDATPVKGDEPLPEPVYLNTFDASNDAQIVGAGTFAAVDDPKFGVVFQNATGGTRQNYLKLPSNVLSHSTETNEMTIGVWVNAANAGASGAYMWSPLFTAYGAAPANNENTWPMLALQYRGVLQVNNSGWCDFTDAQNVNGANALYHDATDWLADHEWHYYTVTLTETSAKVYFDGVTVNEWAVDGNSDGAVIRGLFTNGADLNYACLGGNQAWNWGDPDPGFMFDDFAVYNVELTAAQILSIIGKKK